MEVHELDLFGFSRKTLSKFNFHFKKWIVRNGKDIAVKQQGHIEVGSHDS